MRFQTFNSLIGKKRTFFKLAGCSFVEVNWMVELENATLLSTLFFCFVVVWFVCCFCCCWCLFICFALFAIAFCVRLAQCLLRPPSASKRAVAFLNFFDFGCVCSRVLGVYDYLQHGQFAIAVSGSRENGPGMFPILTVWLYCLVHGNGIFNRGVVMRYLPCECTEF